MKSYGATIQMKPIYQYLTIIIIIFLEPEWALSQFSLMGY